MEPSTSTAGYGDHRTSRLELPIPPGPVGEKAARLLAWFAELPSVAVAFSAGVDSTLVAFAARSVLGSRAICVTADSPSLARQELIEARELAAHFGFDLHVIEAHEIDRSEYRANVGNRCYFCKNELYLRMEGLIERLGVAVIVNGTNLDDLGDHRPGLVAAEEHAVRSPLVECCITKQDVRQLAQLWQLPNADKPAAPCLASRIAYGVEVTPERLAMVEQGEAYLRSLGVGPFRLRLHAQSVARIELSEPDLPRLWDAGVRRALTERFREIGFQFITLDLEGFRSGSLNQLVPVEQLVRGFDRLGRGEG